MKHQLAFAAALAALAALPAAAQTTVVEHVPAFPAFERWVSAVGPAASDVAPSSLRTLPLTLAGPASADTFQPAPVILGLPELPLVGEGASRIGRDWNPTFNYMGVQIRQVVLDATGHRLESRPLSRGIRTGERFKLRVTASFDAIADVDQVVGDVWYGQRTGQVYPQPGLSVELKAGQTVDLPIAPNEYFVMDQPANERLLLKVRHPRALREARSDQPAYRQDGAAASSYLQLVPAGKFPAFEQLVVQTR